MTASQLYALYRAGYVEARRISDGGFLRPFEVSVNGAGLTQLERVILEFALHDAANGTAARSREGFDRAVGQGAELLRGLGLHLERGQIASGAHAMAEAA